MDERIEILQTSRTLDDDGLKSLITTTDNHVANELKDAARQVSLREHGNIIKTRGLIEISNYCRNNCLYCGIRAANHDLERYRLSKEAILQQCRIGADLGFKTYVLQGGEDPLHTAEWIETLVYQIKSRYPDTAITLSLGERPKSDYKRWFDAGAERYLLRHETANPTHYAQLHPTNMSFDNRISCLNSLKSIGYEVGTGMMVGSPYQTVNDLISDLRFIEYLQPHMIGIGPFVSHHSTPFAAFQNGSAELTVRLIAILRLMHPTANIPATTSLGTIATNGRQLGILAGANVVMPNLSPMSDRAKYSLYDNKIHTDLEAAESRYQLAKQIEQLGYILD